MEENYRRMIELFDFLTENDFDVYFIGQKKGKCTKKFIVIRDSRIIPITSNNTATQIIDIIGYDHEIRYTEIEEYKKDIKELMKEYNARFTGEETPVLIEDRIKAYSFILTYQKQKLIYGVRSWQQFQWTS